jgi:1-aminocyclopropane-1-carboxylate deaminase
MCMKSKLLLADIHAPIQRVEDRDLSAAGVELFLKREDLIDPEISGNKWRKVKYNALKALAQPRPCGLVTFGGSFSNHVAATAAVGARLGLKTLAFIRGTTLDCVHAYS